MVGDLKNNKRFFGLLSETYSILLSVMNNTILALEVLWKIAGNFLFNPTATGIAIFFIVGCGCGWILGNRDHNC